MYSVTVAYHLTLCSNNIGTHNETIIDNEFLSASIIVLYMCGGNLVAAGVALQQEQCSLLLVAGWYCCHQSYVKS